MRGSSQCGLSRHRGSLRRRGRKLVAGALCAASLLAGQWLLGEEPSETKPAAPQTVLNQFFQGREGEAPAEPGKRESGVGSRESLRKLKSTAIQTIDNPTLKSQLIENPTIGRSLPAIISPADAKPLAGQEPGVRGQESGVSSPGPKRVEAKPLTLDAPLTSQQSPLTSSTEDGLAPIVPASAMPKRPGGREAGAGSRASGASSRETGTRQGPGATTGARRGEEETR